MAMYLIIAFVVFMAFFTTTSSYSVQTTSRRSAIKSLITPTLAPALAVLLQTPLALADSAAAPLSPKQLNLSPSSISSIVTSDVTSRQFLATADFTRSIYSESCTFTDEIDTYTLPKFVKGTKALFIPEGSAVTLTSPVTATDDLITFKFSEYLQFNIPFKPTVTLTGRVELKRDSDGLISSYQEFWDQSVPSVLKTAKF